jgi:hypothetical protein
LREENGKLKRLVADLSLDRHMLQEIVQVCSLTPILRQTSNTGVPVSACFSANAICSSVNRFALIRTRPSSRLIVPDFSH